MQDIRKVIGNIIKKNRKKLKMTQYDLASSVGVDPKYISRIETGISYPSLSVVEKIFGVLNINISYILEEEQELNKNEMISIINNDLKSTSTKNVSIIKDIVSTITNSF
ncbi:helix-turn-helix transcriptional regulator [bacterium]|nr:helix-turn-helix transcriptional regulator [bacterium]